MTTCWPIFLTWARPTPNLRVTAFRAGGVTDTAAGAGASAGLPLIGSEPCLTCPGHQFSPALSVLKTGTSDGSGKSTLTDLITTLPANQQYTYDFDGVSEVLDHILLTKGIGTFTYQVVHVNAEFANQVSDHDPQVVDIKP